MRRSGIRSPLPRTIRFDLHGSACGKVGAETCVKTQTDHRRAVRFQDQELASQERPLALIGRIFVVLFAFLVASLAAAMVMLIGVTLPIWQDVLTPGVEQGVFSMVAGFGAIFISAVAMLPAMIVIGIAEAFRLRSFLLYAACGGLGMLWLYYGMGFAPAAGPAGLARVRDRGGGRHRGGPGLLADRGPQRRPLASVRGGGDGAPPAAT